jgi:hypothetical protein
MYKADILSTYNDGFENDGFPTVSYNTFATLWKALYPYCTIRSYVDVPGKWFVCGEIDRMRQSSNCKLVKKALAKAHMIHRGGMVMAERSK